MSYHVLCIGDVMLDIFVEGAVHRVSPEAPVLIHRASDTRLYPGGASNVAMNIAALGGHCTLCSVLGDDKPGADLARMCNDASIRTDFSSLAGRRTTTKLRYTNKGQQLLRVDEEDIEDISAEETDAILEGIRSLPPFDVIVVSDYGKGVVTRRLMDGLLSLFPSVPVFVDPKHPDLSTYAGSIFLKPNIAETVMYTGIHVIDNETANLASKRLLNAGGFEGVIITRGQGGASYATRQGTSGHIPSRAVAVADVVGAGDTFMAGLAMEYCRTRDMRHAVEFANEAASIAVQMRGTAVVTSSDIARFRRATAGLAAPVYHFPDDRAGLMESISVARSHGKRIGFTNGCFDILHSGHIKTILAARTECDFLVVAVNSDDSVKLLKGSARPINNINARTSVIAAIGAVDAVVVFCDETPLQLIEQITPDLLVKGGDYTVERVVGSSLVLDRGGKVIICEIVPGQSTSGIAARIQHGEL